MKAYTPGARVAAAALGFLARRRAAGHRGAIDGSFYRFSAEAKQATARLVWGLLVTDKELEGRARLTDFQSRAGRR